MKISTKGRYAVRLMLDLAMSETESPVRLKEIAGRQGISDKYLEQIISILNKAGYVKSVRGPMGGYRLVRKPEEYTVREILELTEGSLSPVECARVGGTCKRQEKCASQILWKRLNDAVYQVVDGVTLEELMSWQKELNHEGM